MILRKPYALLIKYFKLIHVIMAVLLGYLVYKSSMIMNFLINYLKNNDNIIGSEVTDGLFNTFMFIIPFLLIIVSVVVIALMYNKKKPVTFYVVNVLSFIVVVGYYGYMNSLIGTMEVQLVDIRTIRAARDIALGVYAFQLVSSIITLVRATGFDVKKFNFVKDLEDLNIKEEDREEFEVNFELNTHKTERKIRRSVRYLKYYYLENKFMIHTMAVVAVVSLSFFTFMDKVVYNKSFNMGTMFNTIDFNMNIVDSYITKEDSKGHIIVPEDYSLIVLKIKIKTKGRLEKKLNTGKTALKLDDRLYFPTLDYQAKTLDLGNTYNDNPIKNEFVYYTLTYQVPTGKLDNDIEFNYIENVTFNKGKINPNTIHIKLNGKNIDTNIKDEEFIFNKEVNLKNSILKESTFKMNSFELNDSFKHSYKFCVNNKECYDSTEYVKPSIINTNDKTLLKLNGEYKIDPNSGVTAIKSLFQLFKMYGHIEYEIDGKKYRQDDGFKEVVVVNAKNNKETYIEVLKEIKDASSVKLIIKIRNNNYYTILK